MDSDPHPIARALHEGLRAALDPGGPDLARLRAACAAAPADLEARARWLGALSTRSRPEPGTELIDEVVWWLRNRPEHLQHVGHVFVRLSHAPISVHQRVREAWDDVLRTHDGDPEIVLVAAWFLGHHESDRALAMLEKVHEAAPHDPRPAERIAEIWWLRSMRFRPDASPDHDREQAGEALRWFERALERRAGPAHRAPTLTRVCEVALAAGNVERARTTAGELLALADSPTGDWNEGNALYTAHSVLGEIALELGDVERAKEHLSAAARTPGSPQLNSFGPELRLADALLRRGERQAVRDFLREIARFWTSGRSRIELWCLEIERGETPSLSRFARR